MNRREFATKIQDLVNRAYLADIPKSYYEGLFDEAEKLCQPITLTEFLGWEEEVVYRRGGSYFKIEGNHLLHKGHSGKWVNMNLQTWELIDLRQATKVEPKLKAYHVTDEYSYNELMKELEEQGYKWIFDCKPTTGIGWEMYEGNVVIHCEKNKNLSYSSISYHNIYVKDKYDLIEYKKEEPKYYARIKGWEKVSSEKYYWNVITEYKHIFVSDKGNAGVYITQTTKTEWNKLGINDTNADFEEEQE